MVGIVLVSHSSKVAEGIKELASEMVQDNTFIVTAGGMEDGSIGTDAFRISEAIGLAQKGDGVVILADIGSAILSTKTALEFLEEEIVVNVGIADAPILEEGIAAIVQSFIGGTYEEVMNAAVKAATYSKL